MSMREQLDALIAAFRAGVVESDDFVDRLEDIVQASVVQNAPTLTPSDQTVGYAAPTLDETLGDYIDPEKTTNDLNGIMVQSAVFNDRYTHIKQIGQGGIGQVFEVNDSRLDRPVAVKVLKPKNQSIKERHRFVDEAKVTAQLQHPNIIPVYDFGVRNQGEPWFSMKRIFGLSLEQVISELHSKKPNPKISGKFTRFRLLQIFVDVCNALEYAHARGLIHRDIKPDNIMVGDFGEVLLMDWGVAKPQSSEAISTRADHDVLPPMNIERAEETLDGFVVGTPGFMAPEQARGATSLIDHRSDIWALGATLYTMLTGSVPFAKDTIVATLVATVREPVEKPSQRRPDEDIPPDLDDICLRALQKRPENRYQSVQQFRSDIEEFVTGALEKRRRVEEADAWVGQSKAVKNQLNRARTKMANLAVRLVNEPSLTGAEPIATKRMRWHLERELELLEIEVSEAEIVLESHLGRAIQQVPEHPEARRLLTEFHLNQFSACRQLEDRWEARRHLESIRRYGDPGSMYRQNSVELSIKTIGQSAQVYLCQIENEDRVLTTVSRRFLGQTPFNGRIEAGYHLIQLESDYSPTVTTSISAWVGDTLDLEVKLPNDHELGADFVYVPAGHFLMGNDPKAVNGHPGNRVFVDDFAIGRHPITCRQYRDFLLELSPDEQRERIPRDGKRGGTLCWPDDPRAWSFPIVDNDGDEWHEDWPIVSISYDDAVAYCDWRSLVDGFEYRLPTEEEWEKAARGADGRFFPWGNHFDPTFCHMRSSFDSGPDPAPVGSFSTDTSPYGVMDMAGCVKEWTGDSFEGWGYTVRGGSWLLGDFMCRIAGRWGYAAEISLSDLGFRMVKVLNDDMQTRPVLRLS